MTKSCERCCGPRNPSAKKCGALTATSDWLSGDLFFFHPEQWEETRGWARLLLQRVAQAWAKLYLGGLIQIKKSFWMWIHNSNCHLFGSAKSATQLAPPLEETLRNDVYHRERFFQESGAVSNELWKVCAKTNAEPPRDCGLTSDRAHWAPNRRCLRSGLKCFMKRMNFQNYPKMSWLMQVDPNDF